MAIETKSKKKIGLGNITNFFIFLFQYIYCYCIPICNLLMMFFLSIFPNRQQPKSDYTYSTSLTYRDRVTPDRKIGSPNMSRRSLRGGNVGYLKSPDFSTAGLDDELTTSSLNLRNRAVLRSMDALSGKVFVPFPCLCYLYIVRLESDFKVIRVGGCVLRYKFSF